MQNLVRVNDQLGSKDLFDAFKIQMAKDFEQSNFESDFVKIQPDYTSIHKK